MSRITETITGVPRMQAFPWQTAGLTVMRSCQSGMFHFALTSAAKEITWPYRPDQFAYLRDLLAAQKIAQFPSNAYGRPGIPKGGRAHFHGRGTPAIRNSAASSRRRHQEWVSSNSNFTQRCADRRSAIASRSCSPASAKPWRVDQGASDRRTGTMSGVPPGHFAG